MATKDEEILTAAVGEDGSLQNAFSDKTIRRGFIRKVYAILMAQLAFTCGVIAFFSYHKASNEFLRRNSVFIHASWGASMVLILVISCFENARRKAPANFILLSLFTISMSVTLAFTTAYYNSNEVLIAAGITAVVCFSLTIFAFQTKWDFTVLGGSLFVCLIVLFVFGIFAAIFRTHVMQMLYASIGALLFSVYLVYDTQLIIGGDHKYSISPEEYIFASLSLYLDIINIFLNILRLMRS